MIIQSSGRSTETAWQQVPRTFLHSTVWYPRAKKSTFWQKNNLVDEYLIQISVGTCLSYFKEERHICAYKYKSKIIQSQKGHHNIPGISLMHTPRLYVVFLSQIITVGAISGQAKRNHLRTFLYIEEVETWRRRRRRITKSLNIYEQPRRDTQQLRHKITDIHLLKK